ncbi:MAG TPA: FtsX-like permease family protein, partial [Acidimicrobiales bacterium]|nr:FtsX-like permease family protein [Acidimicrobiales bacterium]
MLNVTLEGLAAHTLPALRAARAHRRRLLGTCLAVFLGIAFLSGTLVLGDTLRANFDTLFADANAGTDAIVRSASAIEADGGRGPDLDGRTLIPSALADRLRSVPGVAASEPSIEGYGQLIGTDGKAIGGNGPPRLAGNWITDPELNPYKLVEGRAPQTTSEVVVNRGAAEAGKLRVGDTTIVQTPEPVAVTVVGIASFGTGDGFGAVTFTAFNRQGAEAHVTKKPGVASSIVVRAEPGVDEEVLAERLRPLAGDGTEVLTGTQFTAESTDQIGRDFLDMFTTFLTVFAGVALLVASFSIYNTFSILVAQRSRESALLRALGAARAQIVTSVVVEALLIGLVASVAGLVGGVAIAGLLKGLFDGFGFSLPAGGLAFQASTAVICMVVGLVVTLAAGVFPALKASRVAPVAALREHAVEAARASRLRAVAGGGLTALGVGVVLAAVLGGGDSVLAVAGSGAVLTMVGVVVFGPVVAGPAAAAVGWPLMRLRGVTGALARQNAMRNPRRTSGTAAALMVGVGVVTLFTVFAASIRSSVDDTVSRSFGGDLVVNTGSFGGGGLSPALAPERVALPEVRTAVGLGQGVVQVDGDGKRITVADVANLGEVLDLEVQEGALERLGPTQVAVSTDVGRAMGDTLSIRFVDSATTDFTVGAIYDVGDVAGDYVVSRTAWAPHAGQDVDSQILIGLEQGVGLTAGKAAVTAVTSAAGGASVLDREEYVASVAQGVDMMLGIVYVLLFLAIVIALMGIANT